MSRFGVRHWVACLETQFRQRPGVVHPYNLLGVSYTHTVPADTEFPSTLPRLELFARFENGRGSRVFEVSVVWMDGPSGRELVEIYGPYTVFFPVDRPARSFVFRLQNIELRGIGRYQVRLRMIKPRRRRRLATEYFEVALQP